MLIEKVRSKKDKPELKSYNFRNRDHFARECLEHKKVHIYPKSLWNRFVSSHVNGSFSFGLDYRYRSTSMSWDSVRFIRSTWCWNISVKDVDWSTLILYDVLILQGFDKTYYLYFLWPGSSTILRLVTIVLKCIWMHYCMALHTT